MRAERAVFARYVICDGEGLVEREQVVAGNLPADTTETDLDDWAMLACPHGWALETATFDTPPE